MDSLKLPVHVEVELKPNSIVSQTDIQQSLQHLFRSMPLFMDGVVELSADEELTKHVELIRICDLENQEISYWKAELIFHCYRLVDAGPEKDFLDGEEDLPACNQWELPNKMLSSLWENIICDGDIKRTLLGYASTAMIFTHANVDAEVVSWNRMILLHGPPGTGKTTLCKALAQKVFIRNCSAYRSGVLLEINSHSLFSRWFSESGKLVMKLFDHISEIADDESVFVCVLIDEIESIASARQASVSSNEPSDAVRVVNAVLTSLDALKRRNNVLVLCTSNMTHAIDPAFLDRVDMMIYMGPPSTLARYRILHSCTVELMDKVIISPRCLLLSDPREVMRASGGEGDFPMALGGGMTGEEEGVQRDEGLGGGLLDGEVCMGIEGEAYESRLWGIAARCQGISGRALRRLPLKAHAMFLQKPQVNMDQFLAAMLATVKHDSSSGNEMG